MKKLFLLLTTAAVAQMASAQLTLSGTSYTQNFDNIANGLPAGWNVDTSASATSLGVNINGNFASTVGTTTVWTYTSGNYRNAASANTFPTYAAGTAALQATATDRALAVRQVAATSTTFPGSDPGAAFELNLANTSGLTNFVATFKLQSLDSTVARVTTWTVDYGFGASPTVFTVANPTGTITTGGNTYTNNTITVNFGSALNNQSGPVWIRIVALTAATGSGSRATTGIDDFNLTWSGSGATNYKPLLTAVTPTNNSTNVAVGTNLTMTFDRSITGKAAGNIRIKNETDQTTQTIAGNASNVAVAGKVATISGVTLAQGKVYHVTFDSLAFDTASYHSYGLYDTTTWKFTTVFPVITVSSLSESFNTACAANGIPSGWSQYSVSGPSQTWHCSGATTAPNYYVTMNGYSGGNNVNEDWLITPKLSFNSTTAIVYQSRFRFAGNDLTLMWSSNYSGVGDPTAASWTNLGITYSSADSNAWVTRSKVLPAGSNGFIGFKYISTAADGRQWDVDSVVANPYFEGVNNVSKGNTVPVSVLGNATNGHIVISYDLVQPGMIAATIYDLTGREIYRSNINSSKGTNRITLTPQTLQSGMYIIRISNGSEQGVARTFVN